MKYNPDIHHRRSIRLKGYDYSQAGAYFVTICIQNKECLFGSVIDGEMRLNDAGKTIMACWQTIPEHSMDVEIDESIVMPNHVHGIIVINHNVGAQFIAPYRANASLQRNRVVMNQGVINQGVMNHAPTICGRSRHDAPTQSTKHAMCLESPSGSEITTNILSAMKQNWIRCGNTLSIIL